MSTRQRIMKMKESQYENCFKVIKKCGINKFGLMSNQGWHDDPRRLVFQLSRYKFVAKMFSGFKHVLEVGCADAFGTRLIVQEVKQVTAVDFDPVFIQNAKKNTDPCWKVDYKVHDMVKKPLPAIFDGVFLLDVIEHISIKQEDVFFTNISSSLKTNGVAIIGTPSKESQRYASVTSKLGHINCKTGKELKTLLKKHFSNVFLFSMNDEVVHTGYYPMAHYLFALCCQPIKR
jgi:2-polyprenyl-3-methyl-5-hydroxy-6-metoxy-1,4-benzoquinol methylase